MLNAGACLVGVPPTVVRVTGKTWQIARQGGLSAEAIEELLLCRVLFICTGNTCRSPMAEDCCHGCSRIDSAARRQELRTRFHVQSAGLAAMMGAASFRRCGDGGPRWDADLSEHRSRPVTLDMLHWRTTCSP